MADIDNMILIKTTSFYFVYTAKHVLFCLWQQGVGNMTIPFWCVLLAALLPYVWTGYAKFSQAGYDNNNPRIFLDGLKGRSQRANWAQMNAFEAFPQFAAAVLIASVIGKIDPTTLSVLSVTYLLCRFLHGVFYILDKANLRTTVWIIAAICWVSMYVLSV